MCGRYSLVGESLDAQALEDLRVLLGYEPQFANEYNMAPSLMWPVIRLVDKKRKLDNLVWNFRPQELKDKNDALPNARAEGPFKSNRHKSSAATRRCLVPATGWYEWKPVTGGKRPFAFRTLSPLLLFAGILTCWVDGATGEAVDSYAIITTDANRMARVVHNRMPVILTGDARIEWLESSISEPEDVDSLMGLLEPYRGTDLEVSPVSTYVSNPRNQCAQCLGPERDVFS